MAELNASKLVDAVLAATTSLTHRIDVVNASISAAGDNITALDNQQIDQLNNTCI